MEFLLLCRGYKRRSQRDTHSRPFLLLLWDEFFFSLSFILFCISKLLASKDRTRLDERRLCRAGGIYRSHPLPFSLFYMYFEVLHRVISEGGQQQCLTDECFLNISCAHQMCVSVCVCVLKEEADLQGVMED